MPTADVFALLGFALIVAVIAIGFWRAGKIKPRDGASPPSIHGTDQ